MVLYASDCSVRGGIQPFLTSGEGRAQVSTIGYEGHRATIGEVS